MKKCTALLFSALIMIASVSCFSDNKDSEDTCFGRIYNSTSYPVTNLKIGSATFPTIDRYSWSPSTEVPIGKQDQSWTWNGTEYSQSANIEDDFEATYYGYYDYSY